MHLYCGTVEELMNLCFDKNKNGTFKTEVSERFMSDLIKRCGEEKHSDAELKSWEKSVPKLIGVLYKAGYRNIYVILEYSVPLTGNRMDVILAGKNKKGKPLAVVVELKQWSKIFTVANCEKVEIIVDEKRGTKSKRIHPCVQLELYKKILEEHHSNVTKDKIQVETIAYLHNFVAKKTLFEGGYNVYKDYEDRVFIRGKKQEEKLIAYLEKLGLSENKTTHKKIIEGKYENPKEVYENIEKILMGEECIELLGEQGEILKKIEETQILAKKNNKKLVVLISGAPGTGKSILGLHILSTEYKKDIENNRDKCIYATYNKVLREVLKRYISRDEKIRKSIVDLNAFKGQRELELIVVDEAQRFNDIKTIQLLYDQLASTGTLILLQDDKQRIRANERGTKSAISKYVKTFDNVEVLDDLYLKTNLRMGCGTSFEELVDEFLSDKPLSQKRKHHINDYEVTICKSLTKVEESLMNYVDKTNAKWLAPICWKSTEDGKVYVNSGFQKEWAPFSEKDAAKWYVDYSKTNHYAKVGNVFHSQGLDFDYVGVIVWDDLFWEDGKWKINLNRVRDQRALKLIIKEYGKQNDDVKLKEDYIVIENHVEKEYKQFLEERNLGEIKGSFEMKRERIEKEGARLELRYRVKEKNKTYVGITEYLETCNVAEEGMNEIIGLIKNNYRVLFTRAKKGLYIYFRHKETQARFEELLKAVRKRK